MATNTPYFQILALGSLLLLLSKRANATIAPSLSIDDDTFDVAPTNFHDSFDVVLFPFDSEIMDTIPNALNALLYVIRRAEHTAQSVANGDDYKTFYGGSLFTSFDDHPVITGEKRGVKLSDKMCAHAGYGPGCVSTAAGAYQIKVDTWKRIRRIEPHLADFSPLSQDIAAIRLIQEKGADKLIANGDFTGAMKAISGTWASIHGSIYGQPTRSIDELYSFFDEGLRQG